MNLFQNILDKAKGGLSSYNTMMEGVGSKAYDWANPNQDPIQRFLDDPKIDSQKKQALFADLQSGKPKEAISSYLTEKYYPEAQFRETIPMAKPFFPATGKENPALASAKLVGNIPTSLYNVVAGGVNIASTGVQEGFAPTLSMLGKGAVRGIGQGAQALQSEYQAGGGGVTGTAMAGTKLIQGAQKVLTEDPTILFAPQITKGAGTLATKGGKAITTTAQKVAPKIKAIPKAIKKAPGIVDDAIESGVERLATKALGSSDGTAELFKATSPSYNVLAKSKDISKIKQKARLADEAVVDAGFVPKTTTERVSAYSQAMKKYWNDVETARGASKVEFDAGEIAKVIDDEIQRLSVKGVINPAIQGDISALMKQVEYFRGLGKIDMPTLGNQRTLINTITDWGAKTEYGDTFSAVMKKAVAKIREAEDSVLGSIGGGKASDALGRYGALRSMYDDIVKQDIKALRAKGLPIEESFGRIAGTAELLGGIGQLVMNPKQAIPTLLSGGSKVLLGKVAGKMKDPDYLIRTGYEKLLKSKKPTNGNTPRNTPVVRPNSTRPTGEQKVTPKTLKKEVKPPLTLSTKGTMERKVLKQSPDIDKKPYTLGIKNPIVKRSADVEIARGTSLKVYENGDGTIRKVLNENRPALSEQHIENIKNLSDDGILPKIKEISKDGRSYIVEKVDTKGKIIDDFVEKMESNMDDYGRIIDEELFIKTLNDFGLGKLYLNYDLNFDNTFREILQKGNLGIKKGKIVITDEGSMDRVYKIKTDEYRRKMYEIATKPTK